MPRPFSIFHLPFSIVFLLLLIATAPAAPLHGLWVWNPATTLSTPAQVEALRDFCQREAITEIYLSTPRKDFATQELQLPALLDTLHQAHLRVEALLDSIDADLPGPRETLLQHVDTLLAFNSRHPETRFDGLHLDIEPHQRAENKGPGNLRFLPGLIETFRAITARATAAGLTTNADIANKFLKAPADQRRQLLLSVPRLTLMLYELNSPTDGKTLEQKLTRLQDFTARYFTQTYADLSDPDAPSPGFAQMAIALRTPDYLTALPTLLKSLDTTNAQNPHYLGWSRHSYNDVLPAK